MKKITTIILMTLFVFGLSISTFADQAAYVSEKQAKKAAQFLKEKGTIRRFCAPCGDKQSHFEKIETIEAVSTGYQNYWEVKVNGKGIDLAYVYYEKKKGRWKNTAMRMDIDVSDVPRFLSGKEL